MHQFWGWTEATLLTPSLPGKTFCITPRGQRTGGKSSWCTSTTVPTVTANAGVFHFFLICTLKTLACMGKWARHLKSGCRSCSKLHRWLCQVSCNSIWTASGSWLHPDYILSHTARATGSKLESIGISVLPWPANGPNYDLVWSPMESMKTKA